MFYRQATRSDELVPLEEMFPGRVVWGAEGSGDRVEMIVQDDRHPIPVEEHRKRKRQRAFENSRKYGKAPTRTSRRRHMDSGTQYFAV